jgi:hypothetical protein
MTPAEIVKALREECKTCSENSVCENGVNLAGLYCANKDAASLIERLTAENTALREGASLGKAKRPQKKAYEKSIEFLRALTDGQSDEIKSLRRELEGKDMVIILAQRKQAEAEAERDALREKQRWIPVTERLPEERALVNVVWVNRAPEPYYEKIKGVPFSDTACFYRGRWYWASPVVLDLLAEYGEDEPDSVDEAVEITHWLPLPEAPEEGEKA